MILIHDTCTPPTQRRVLHDQLEVISLVASSHISSISPISLAGFAPVSYSWRYWRS